MSRFDWLPELLAGFESELILVHSSSAEELAPAHTLTIDAEDWGRMARVALAQGCRWCGMWGDDPGDENLVVTVVLEIQGDYLALSTKIPKLSPVLTSHTPWYAAADRMERHAQDLYGIAFLDHPDDRRWCRHAGWPENVYPLRKDQSAAGHPEESTPPDADYPFLSAQGSGVYEIPVGPVHAGIIEPGHFRFQAVGEMILNLEERLGYVHKGIEKIAEGRDMNGLARLAGRVSGDTTVGHAWAASMACERAAGISVPERALFLRAVAAERERIGNHLGDIGAICNDVGFAFPQYQFTRLREDWLRDNNLLSGHRLMMDWVVPGGLSGEPNEKLLCNMPEAMDRLEVEVRELCEILDNNSSLEDRLVSTGVLSHETAARLGALGYVGRASGRKFDLRLDAPYPPYDTLEVTVPLYDAGDVDARMRIRREEIFRSLGLLRQLLQKIPAGPVRTNIELPAQGAQGLGLVEGWRGEILAYVRFGASGTVARYFPRDPSWLNWPALEKIARNNIVPDFPVCNKSVNGSYSGHDL